MNNNKFWLDFCEIKNIMEMFRVKKFVYYCAPFWKELPDLSGWGFLGVGA